jgi:uncharacterized protein with PIN domain
VQNSFGGDSMKCHECKDGLLEFISGSFASGVFAPDGAQETLYEEWYECDRCGRKFDATDLPTTEGIE